MSTTSRDDTTGRSGIRPLLSGADADLDARDPAFIRANLPLWWLLATVYHRAEVDGFEHVPDTPVMFVGNHSGGSMTPDAFLFLLSHQTYFSVDRPVYALAHAFVTSVPLLGDYVRRIGVVTAGPEAAGHVFDAGADVLVYPGGDVDALRPWKQRNRINFDGRTGFLRIAHAHGVPIVPVTTTGAHDTFIVLNDGRKLARTLRFDRLLRVKSVPVVASLPWGISLGDWFGHIPLPTKVRVRIGEPIDLRERYGDRLDVDDAYRYVRSSMQVQLSRLAAERVLPPFR
jgi:1-acyl-sn-glycerol-3-phosphate acyltransferase